MPASVILAIGSLAIMICLTAINFVLALLSGQILILAAVSVALGALVLMGMIVGQRLAWQWGRVLGLLAALLYTWFLAVTLATGPPRDTNPLTRFASIGYLGIVVACLYTIFFALGRSSALDHFGLKCLSCQHYTNAGANFLFTKARCKKCGNVW
jgi:hypothetical protein